ncbi:MAG: hypothetical protein JEZ05_04190 [Tenericutes bacterium]|nr:hypothetical protein [Mycoplasmatota bacterium]
MKITFSFNNLRGTEVLPKISIGLYDLDGVSKVAIDNQKRNLEMIVEDSLIEKIILKVRHIAEKLDENLTFEYSVK